MNACILLLCAFASLRVIVALCICSALALVSGCSLTRVPGQHYAKPLHPHTISAEFSLPTESSFSVEVEEAPTNIVARVTLSWSPVTAPLVAGYYVYRGTQRVWAGQRTSIDVLFDWPITMPLQKFHVVTVLSNGIESVPGPVVIRTTNNWPEVSTSPKMDEAFVVSWAGDKTVRLLTKNFVLGAWSALPPVTGTNVVLDNDGAPMRFFAATATNAVVLAIATRRYSQEPGNPPP